MRILRLDPADGDAIRACFDTREAGRADDPFKPPESLRVFRTDLFSVWDGSPAEAWYAPDTESSAAGWYTIVFPDRENLHYPPVAATRSPRCTMPAVRWRPSPRYR